MSSEEKQIVQDRILWTSKLPKFPCDAWQISQPYVSWCKHFKIFSNNLTSGQGQGILTTSDSGATKYFCTISLGKKKRGGGERILDLRLLTWHDFSKEMESGRPCLAISSEFLSTCWCAMYYCGPLHILLKTEILILSAFHHGSKTLKFLLYFFTDQQRTQRKINYLSYLKSLVNIRRIYPDIPKILLFIASPTIYNWKCV